MSREQIFVAQEFGHSLSPGRRSALLVIDFVNGFADPAIFGGGNIASAIKNTRVLLDEARRRCMPVCYTRIAYPADRADSCVFQMKAPRLKLLIEGSPLAAVVEILRPLPGELLVTKRSASAFFGTQLLPFLIDRNIDNIIVAGCTTSGCVRATVVDAMSYNYRCFVVEDCVGDRSLDAHEASLFDMRQKYADVYPMEASLALMARHQTESNGS